MFDDHRCCKLAVSAVLGCGTMLLMAGCAAPDRIEITSPCSLSHIVFNPEWSDLPTLDVARTDWPVAYTLAQPREETDYAERIIDVQGRQWGAAGDHVYRRFESARIGRSRR